MRRAVEEEYLPIGNVQLADRVQHAAGRVISLRLADARSALYQICGCRERCVQLRCNLATDCDEETSTKQEDDRPERHCVPCREPETQPYKIVCQVPSL